MIEPINTYVALLDACVLAPMPLCHTILNLAEEPALYIPKWSEEILAEVSRVLKRLHRSDEQILRRLTAMRTAFEDASVKGYEALTPVLGNDPKDRHVLAAAIRCHANVIVTHNIRHFPEESLAPYGILRTTPDEFLCNQYHLEPGITIDAIDRQASDVNKDIEWILVRLKSSAPKFASLIQAARYGTSPDCEPENLH